MNDNEVLYSHLYTTIDILQFIGGLALSVFMFAMGNASVDAIHDYIVNKNEVVIEKSLTQFNGVNNNGTVIYDGKQEGSQVINDIISNESNYQIFIVLAGGTKINLSAETYNGMPLIEYAKVSDVRKLSAYIDADGIYYRLYEYDSNGEMESVTYKLDY